MNTDSIELIQVMVLELLKPKLADAQVKECTISLDDDLYELGIVDSYDVVELLSDITEKTGTEVDLSDIDSSKKFILSINSLSALFLRTK